MLKMQKINVFCVLLVNHKIDLFTVVLLGYFGPTPKLLPIVFCAILYAKLAYLFLYLSYVMAPTMLAQGWLG